MRDVGLGLIGLGRLGMTHLVNISRGVPEGALVALCDMREELVQETARQVGARAYTHHRHMLEDDSLDAVVIVTPTHQHKDLVIDFARAGKHIFCEKPMAPTVEESAQMVDAIRKAGIIFQVGYMRRFDPAYAEAKALVDSGRIGRPVLFKAVSRDPFPPPAWALDPSTGGGLYIDMHTHDFDLARWLMGQEIEYVSVEQARLVFHEVDVPEFADNTVMNLRFRNGAVGNVDGSYNACYGYDVRTEVLGDQGAIFVGELKDKPVVLAGRDGIANVSTFTTGELPHFMRRFNEAYAAELRHFVSCVVDGESPLVNEVDGHAALQVAEACLRAARTGARTKVDHLVLQ